MGRPNWTRPLAYSTARSQTHCASPTCRAAVSTAPSRRHHAATSGPATGSPAGSTGRDQTGVSGSIGRGSGVASNERGSRRSMPASDNTRRTSRSARCSMITGSVALPTAPATGRSTRPTTTVPSSAPSMSPAARWLATSGPGINAYPSASNTSAASARPRPTPPAASAKHRLNTPASPSWRHPSLLTTRSVDSVARIDSRGKTPSHSRRMPSASSVWNSVTSKSIVVLTLLPGLGPQPWPLPSPGAPWGVPGSARRRCSVGSARCPRRWSGRYPAASPRP